MCVLLTGLASAAANFRSPPIPQGVAVELLRGSAAPGAHVDVGGPRHHRPALSAFPDPVRRLRLAGGFCHRHGALHPAQRGGAHDTLRSTASGTVNCRGISGLRLHTAICRNCQKLPWNLPGSQSL